MIKQHVVQCPVQQNYVGVKKITKKGSEDVYCLTTKKNGNFIANGIVVKNCDSVRYALYTHLFAKEGGRLTAKDIDRNYRQSQGGSVIDLPRELTLPEEEWGGF